MIHTIKKTATSSQVQDMLQQYEVMLKLVVDIRHRVLSGGGEMHADNEKILLEKEGSEQDDLWGANWYPDEERIEFESLINIRPRLGSRNIIIQDPKLRDQMESVIRELLGGIKC